MALLRTVTGSMRGLRLQLLLYCSILALILYLVVSRRAAVPATVLYSPVLPHLARPGQAVLTETSWGAPVVWGDSGLSGRVANVHTALIVLVVGNYAHFAGRFLSSAEKHFLSGRRLTYYFLTDNPRTLEPPPPLGPGRRLKVVEVAELPGWERLHLRRLPLVADTIRRALADEDGPVDYVFCSDVDLEFVASVGDEVLGKLVAVLHPELYGRPREDFPYEDEPGSSAMVPQQKGELYYTSELYGGRAGQVLVLAEGCSLLLLQDQAVGLRARRQEESYLNRYLIDHRPSRVLSPEYGWYQSAQSAPVPVHRVLSRGRSCLGPCLHRKH